MFRWPILRRAPSAVGRDLWRNGRAVAGKNHSGWIELLDAIEPVGPGGEGSANAPGCPAREVCARVRRRAAARRPRSRGEKSIACPATSSVPSWARTTRE